MPIFLDSENKKYQPYRFEKESNFEKVVNKLSDDIFGNSSIYLEIKRQVKGKEIISIPDSYLIDLEDCNNPRLFVIENEIVSHDPFKHIGIQMLKFITSSICFSMVLYCLFKFTKGISILHHVVS